MRPIDSATVSILHSAASIPWWGWVFLLWIGGNIAFVALRHRATREDHKQVVFDAFDGKRTAAIADYQAAKDRRDTRRMNAAAERARAATIVELQSIVRGGR